MPAEEIPPEQRPMGLRALEPPPWRSVLSTTHDLGYPDYFPARPGNNQPEDVITEQNAKYGFQGVPVVSVPTENFSVHGPITTKLKSASAMENLSKLADEIIAVKKSQAPIIPPHSFKLPNRVVLNPHMRASFISDLASPSFPLHRLAKSVPHGFKGVELLEMLWNNEVPVGRGVWLVQALGAHEVQAIRNRPSTSAAALISPSDQYSTEFTSSFCLFLKKQLQEIVGPLQGPVRAQNPTRGSGNGIGVMAEGEGRDKWVRKWEYSLELLQLISTKQFLCPTTLALFLTEQIASAHPSQLGFVLALTERHLESLLEAGGTVGRGVVRVCAEQLVEVRRNTRRGMLKTIEDLLVYILRTIHYRNRESFFTPTTWQRHSDLLLSVLRGDTDEQIRVFDEDPGMRRVMRRNERMLLKRERVKEGVDGDDKKTMSDIQILDSICSSSNMRAIYNAYCGKSPTHFECTESEARRKVQALLSWSIEFSHLSNHRPYACGTLLRMSKEDPQAFGRKSKADRLRWLENFVYEWLDTSQATLQEHKMHAIGLVVGELTRLGLFSYGDYLKLITSRKLAGNTQDKETTSRHLQLLKHLPIYSAPPALLYQRKIALYGFQQIKDPQTAEIAAVKREMGSYLSELQTGYDPTDSSDETYHELPLLRVASRFVQVQVRLWLLPILRVAMPILLEKGTVREQLSLAKVLNVVEIARGTATIYDIVVNILPQAGGLMLKTVLDVIARHVDGWAAMDRLESMTEMLCKKHIALLQQGIRNKHLVRMLTEFRSKGCLTEEALSALLSVPPHGYSAKAKSYGTSAESVPPILITVQNIQREADLSKVDKIARDLWQRFEHDKSFPKVVWSNALEGLKSTGASRSTSSLRQMATLPVASLLATISELRSEGLEDVIQAWCARQATQHFSDLSVHPDSPIAELFCHLLAMGVISRNTMLEGLLYPTWKLLITSKTVLSGNASVNEINVLSFSTNLTRLFFLPKPTMNTGFPLHNLVNVQSFRAGLTSIFDETKSICALIDHLALMVVLEVLLHDYEDVAMSLKTLREGMSILPNFKTGAFRNLDYLKDAFLSRKFRIADAARLDAAMVEGLLLIMTEVDESQSNPSSMSYDWTNAVAAMSPWHWKRTVLELRLSFKRLSMQGQSSANGDGVKENSELSAILEQQLSEDQLALVREALKGIDPVAVHQLVRAGISRISRLAHDLASEREEVCASARSHIDCVIDILALAMNHLDANHTPSGSLLPCTNLAECFEGVRGMLSSLAPSVFISEDKSTGEDLGQVRLDVCLRLVQFLLLVTQRLPGSMPTERRSSALIGLLSPAFDLCLALAQVSSTSLRDCADTFAYILDEIPPDKRSATTASMSQYAKKFKDSPHQPQSREWQGLGEVLPLMGLARWQESQEPDQTLSADRRWELLPYLQPAPSPLRHRENVVQNSRPTNSGSISLEAFGAVYTGDRSFISGEDSASSEGESEPESRTWELFVSERDIGRGLTGESSFVRDWMAGSANNARICGDADLSSKEESNIAPADGTPATAATSAGQPTPIGNSTADPIEIVDDDEEMPLVSSAPAVVPAKRPGSEMTTPDIEQIPAMKKQKVTTIGSGTGMGAKKTPRKASISAGKAGKKLPMRTSG